MSKEAEMMRREAEDLIRPIVGRRVLIDQGALSGGDMDYQYFEPRPARVVGLCDSRFEDGCFDTWLLCELDDPVVEGRTANDGVVYIDGPTLSVETGEWHFQRPAIAPRRRMTARLKALVMGRVNKTRVKKR